MKRPTGKSEMGISRHIGAITENACGALDRPRSPKIALGLVCLVGWFLIIDARLAGAQSGFRDFSYGATCNSTPTGEKPESKLWINDGFWWGSLCNPTANKYHIYRLDLATQSWVDTGTVLDDRSGSKADILWDDAGQKLYVASHTFTTSGQPSTTSSQWGRLYRYSYDKVSEKYGLDAGFPVTVTHGRSETLVLAKDSTGRLWVTYVENSKVMVNHSLGSDAVWGDPFVLPVASSAVTLTSDDISSIISFQNNKIGLMWSNQLQLRFYFAVHVDGDGDTAWLVDQATIPGAPCSGACGDDHINLKTTHADGRIFAAIKTSLAASTAPLDMLAVRDAAGNWSSYVFGTKADAHTRPIVLLNEETARLYMFATSPESGGSIFYKSTDLNNINFPAGRGQPFIQDSTDTRINNSSSTKQNLSSSTGLVVIASDQGTTRYLHNFLSLGASTLPTAAFSGSPTTGQAPLTVQFTDLSSGTPTAWNWSFGDGSTSAVQNPSHTYSAAGGYTVSLTVTNTAGSSTVTKTNYIAVTSATLTAAFSGSPTAGQAPLGVQFTDLSSGTPTAWNWSFGDGSTSVVQNPSHTYSTAGSYSVSLTVTNTAGSSTVTKANYIAVTSAVLTAGFSGSPTTGQAPLSVQFTDLSGGTPTAWNWSFGDGSTSVVQNPSHTYSAAGSYNVSLTVSNATGSDTATKTGYITVSAPGGTVAFQETQTGISSNSSQVTTTSSLTGVAGHLYLAAVSTRPNLVVTGITGLGLSWHLVRTQCSGRNQTGISIWMAQGTPTGNGSVTASLGSTALNAVIDVSRYSGASSLGPIGNIVSGNTNGSGGVCSGGTDSNAYSFDLTATTVGAAIYGAVAMRNRTNTPGGGYTERAEVSQGTSGDVASVATQDMLISVVSTILVNGLLSGTTDWAVVGFEIKP